MRQVVVGAAQLGPIQRDEDRASVLARMLVLLDEAAAAGCTLVVYPELALTTFFPRWDVPHPGESAAWFETGMPNTAVQPLFDRAAASGIALSFGYAEATPDGHHFNTSILTDTAGKIVLKYRKIHLPGHAVFDPERTHQHLEKKYFEPGDLGFPVTHTLGGVMGMMICNDRRWPESWRMLGLQGVEMVLLGYNTPTVNSQKGAEGLEDRLFHHRLSVQAGAYQNATWAVAVAKAGNEDGHPLMAGTLIVNPDGHVVGEIAEETDALLVHACDLDACTFGKTTIFDFARHRRIEHYGPIASQTGAVAPSDA